MKIIQNECCDCASGGYHCIGAACALRKVAHFYCDRCREEVNQEELYDYLGRELCAECLLDVHPRAYA